MQPNNYYTSSPTVVLPAQNPNSYFGTRDHYAASDISMTNGFVNPFPAAQNASAPITPSPGAIAGRKRSRGDINDPDDDGRDDDGSVPTPPASNPSQLRGQPVYGPGMTIIYPDDPGYTAHAESQTGTWAEAQAQTAQSKRPSITSRKSQRIDSTTVGSNDLAQLVVPPTLREVTQEPLIDEAMRLLGISWTRMDISEARLINQAAYAKWIQNHYPCLKNVSVWMENGAMPCYLVCANNAYSGQQEYYLFSNDLTEARLVTREPSQLVPRLQLLPALHLAAPGGCIRAETDPISADQNELNVAQAEMAIGETSSTDDDVVYEPQGMCAAHSMEMD